MTISLRFRSAMTGGAAVVALCAGGGIAQAQFMQTDLVSDVTGLAEVTDPNLKNLGDCRSCPGVRSGFPTRAQARPRSIRWRA
jgi:hypothetical protein